MGTDTRGEGLGRPCRPARRGRARPALHRSAPAARGDQPAGLRRPAPERPPGAAPRPHHRDRGPQHPDPRHRQADRRPGLPRPAGDAAQELRRVRRPAAPAGRRRAGRRPRRRPAAGPDPARHDGRLRRLAHLHARRVRRAGVRHRHLARSSTCWPPRRCRWPVQDHGDHGRRASCPTASPPRT